MKMKARPRGARLFLLFVPLLACPPLLAAPAAEDSSGNALPHFCSRKIRADVVALDQVYFWNRLGAVQPQGMVYALRDDVVHVDQDESSCDAPRLPLQPGQVRLRAGKRPRPLVLRMNAGDCLEIGFQNLLSRHPADQEQPRTRAASVHVVGLQAVQSVKDMGMDVGNNGPAGDGVVLPGESATYMLYAEKEGTYLMYSGGALAGGEGLSGSISAGLFGAVNVEPRGSEWYRSQVTRKELDLASVPFFRIFREHPVIDYGAVYPNRRDPEHCWRRRGTPILRMLNNRNEIVHSDLTAIITGPGAGRFPTPDPPSTGLYPTRDEPFREFTIIFHDEIGAVQAFPQFEQPELKFTLHSVRDAFAINYGTGGAGAEILANRFGVGPMHDCPECKYEEFFLTSWVVGDPAMVVDVPANAPCMVRTEEPQAVDQNPRFHRKVNRLRHGVDCPPRPGPKATKAFYPDDPSNVYHSYLNDRVKFRNLHAGSDDHHIFHLHAHQWTHTPASDESSYLDSQAIGQGASFTYEIAYGGGGNRNLTVGDAIFHCHFYPHFAQGMWGLWRVHDVFEQGTRLDANGRPSPGSRALPDGEIPRGTPIPAVVPMPTLAMAPLPGKVTIAGGQAILEDLERNPGYPFFIPGRAGHRPPHPPLDTIHDGGLPRHLAVDGIAEEKHTRLDFSKIIHELDVEWLKEEGEEAERLAMEFHAEPGGHRTPTPGFALFGRKVFRVNGRPAVAGAPFADPCLRGDGAPVPREDLRIYKAADIQIDAIFNKAGWHFPQQRMLALWRDVEPTLQRKRPPEPLFIRAENGDCVEYQLTNLVPNEYHVDDFQVRTPTDILGQHIHLVKFDVTSSDGAANGFNYEDGSFSPEEVRERINAIRAANGCDEPGAPPELPRDPLQCPQPKLHPFFGDPDSFADPAAMKDLMKHWRGAQTTVQRWWADPIPQKNGGERSLRTVFTHDHFGPSTHQQTGLYAGLLVEPKGSEWFHNETLCKLGGRDDGGPTTWQARIRIPDLAVPTPEGDEKSRAEVLDQLGVDYREFALAFADFQLAYKPGSRPCPAFGGPVDCFDPTKAINPPGRKLIGPPLLYQKPQECPDSNAFAPCPEAVSADDPGTAVVNYRNEPLALRIKKREIKEQAEGQAGDLSFAYSSMVEREDPAFNQQPSFYPPLTRGLRPRDPFTPMMRVKEGDRVQIKVLIGAHEEEHEFTVHNIKWFAEPDDPASGYRNAQMMGISEWFDFDVPRVPDLEVGQLADFLYKPSAASEWQWNGLWGLLRVYRGGKPGEGPPPLCEDDQGFRRETPWLMSRTDIRSPEFLESQAEVGLQGEDLENLGSNEDGRITLQDQRFQRDLLTTSEPPEPGIAVPLRRETGREQRPSTVCPIEETAPGQKPREPRVFRIAAVAASDAVAVTPDLGRTLVYNRRNTKVKTARKDLDLPNEPPTRSGPLHDPTAILFVHEDDLTCDASGKCRPPLKAGIKPEPLILRASAGECIVVELTNMLPSGYTDLHGWTAVPMIIENFNANQVKPSLEVGLHPQLVAYDVRCSDGVNVGLNECENKIKQTVGPGGKIFYYWYAGHIEVMRRDRAGYNEELIPIPVEFGSIALSSSDPIKHTNKGAVGALIIEPEGATWNFHDPGTRASATVTLSDGRQFREFVTVFQDNVNLRYADGAPVESLDLNEDATESGQKAINYRTDPLWFRIGLAPDTPTAETRNFRFFDRVLTNAFIGGLDPETPVFRAKPGEAIRFRVVHPGGHTQAHTFEVHGHLWQELPYVAGTSSKENPPVPRPLKLGENPESELQGARGGHGPANHFDALLRKAGGERPVPRDYLYRDYPQWLFYDGIWGILRIIP